MKQDWDVVVIGGGPTGLVAAHLLGRMGVRTLLVERNTGTVEAPRAVSIDDEALRTMQAAGVLEDILPDIALDYGWRIQEPSGRQIYRIHPATREYGFPRRNAFVQPLFEAALRRALPRLEGVEAWFGAECTELTEGDGEVRLRVRLAPEVEADLHARYVIGADGAHSFVRKAIGAVLEGSTYDQRWLIVDLEGTKDRYRESRGYSDPARPAVNLPGPDGRRRFEFMLHPRERDEDVTDEAFVRALIARYGPDRDAKIARQQVYAFHARVADTWQTKRVFLCGDAAHLSPPFAGQGVNSAFRDVHNIAWKIASVLRGDLGPGVLATYQDERKDHARALIDLAISNGRLLMVQSGWRAKALHLGYRLATLFPPVAEYYTQMKNKPKATYTRGFLVPGAAESLVGRLCPQPVLELADGSAQRMDDLIGPGFALVVTGADAQAVAGRLAGSDLGLRSMDGAGALPVLAIVPWDYNLDRDAPAGLAGRDRDNTMQLGAPVRVMLLRPDRYVAYDALLPAASPEAATAAIRALVQATRS